MSPSTSIEMQLVPSVSVQWAATGHSLRFVKGVLLVLSLLVIAIASPPAHAVASLSAGGHHNLLVRDDGSVWAWGRNDSGQLGDGTNVDRPYMVRTLGISHVQQASAGLGHSLALLANGIVAAWGQNDGQIGDNTT